jgi:hypothetical protein
MNRRELRDHKRAPKLLPKFEFRPLKRGSLPKPLKEMGGPRLMATRLLDVGNGMKAVFLARTGDVIERKAFFAYLFEDAEAGLTPLAILHYHPSHKGVHMIVRCETGREFAGRQLPGAPELALRSPRVYDPDDPRDRDDLILAFCRRCNIAVGATAAQLPL